MTRLPTVPSKGWRTFPGATPMWIGRDWEPFYQPAVTLSFEVILILIFFKEKFLQLINKWQITTTTTTKQANEKPLTAESSRQTAFDLLIWIIVKLGRERFSHRFSVYFMCMDCLAGVYVCIPSVCLVPLEATEEETVGFPGISVTDTSSLWCWESN